MPLLNGIEVAEQLSRAGVGARIIFLTMHLDVMYATRAFEAGASGYVLKHSAPSELVTAIREVLKGRTYITPLISKDLLGSIMRRSQRPEDVIRKLTPRQREILQLVAEGKTAKEIASLLSISTRTVEFHKYRMMENLGLKTSAELVQFAIKHGIASG
jgi:DNA-binding NarL/FixJ family response regulator